MTVTATTSARVNIRISIEQTARARTAAHQAFAVRFRRWSPLRPSRQLFRKSAKLIGRLGLEFCGQSAPLRGYLALCAAEVTRDLSVCFAVGDATQKLLLAWA
jgi:hypothetical protein